MLKVPSYNGEGKDGRLWWFEFQSAKREKWEAELACNGRNWAYEGLSFSDVLSNETTVECVDFNYPLTDAKTNGKYRRNGKPTIDLPKLDAIRLAGKIASTDGLVEQFQLPKAT